MYAPWIGAPKSFGTAQCFEARRRSKTHIFGLIGDMRALNQSIHETRLAPITQQG